MTITELVLKGRGRAGSRGAWRAERPGDGNTYLYHYGTLMLAWTHAGLDGVRVIHTSQGRNSVSDQGGMNKAFRALGLSLYFSRKDGTIR